MKTNFSKLSAKYADAVLEVQWDKQFPVDPVAIALKFGIKTLAQDMNNISNGMLGALVKTKESEDPVILVDEDLNSVRKRFTVAHELGHYIYNALILGLQGTYSKYDFRGEHSKAGKNPEEIFANGFAAALLMPKEEILKHVMPKDEIRHEEYITEEEIIKLSSKSHSSLESISYRLKFLGINIESWN